LAGRKGRVEEGVKTKGCRERGEGEEVAEVEICLSLLYV
jgi:hypothetical protein